MKKEKIIKDGKLIGLRGIAEVGDTTYEQIGEFIYLEKEPTLKEWALNLMRKQQSMMPRVT